MPRIIKSFLFILFLFTVSNAQTPKPTATPDDEPEKVFTEEIKLNVSAVDRNGKFFAGVKPEDLVIMEDGRLHQPSSLRRIPAKVLILLDTGGEMRAKKGFDNTKNTARTLINALADNDSVAIMDYHDKVEVVAEWTNKEDAIKALNTKTNFGRRSVFINALEAATDFLQKTPLDNRHLVLISDGTDSINDQSERRDAMQKVLATDINVHVLSYTKMELVDIEPRSKGMSKGPKVEVMQPEIKATLPNGVRDVALAKASVTINTDREFLKKMRERKTALLDSENFLTTLSSSTNGAFILPETNEEMIEKTTLVAAIIDSSYVVTYTPKRALSESPNGEERDIEISSRRPNLQVQAKRKLIVKN